MGDWGKRIRLVFGDDGGGSTLYSINPNELVAKFRLKEDNYNTYIYPSSVTVGNSPNELFINFADINQAQMPCTLEYLGGAALRGKDLPVEEFVIATDISWWNLDRHGGYEQIELTSVEVTGDIALGFYGKTYHAEHIEITALVATGTNAVVTFKKGYTTGENIEITTLAVSGIYADVNGVPI